MGFVILAVACALVALVRCLEAELTEWRADRDAVRRIDRRRPTTVLPPALTGLRPAPRPYDWRTEPVELHQVRARARGGAA
jgi:hypothetical protein